MNNLVSCLSTPRAKNHHSDTIFREKWTKKDSRLKPFGFCCSLDRFDPLSRYDQRMPPNKSPLIAITSVHECPVIKMQTKFSTSRLSQDKKKPTKIRTSDVGDQRRRSKNDGLNYSEINRNNRCIKRYLEEEVVLAKDIFWTEKQRIFNEENTKTLRIGKKKREFSSLNLENKNVVE